MPGGSWYRVSSSSGGYCKSLGRQPSCFRGRAVQVSLHQQCAIKLVRLEQFICTQFVGYSVLLANWLESKQTDKWGVSWLTQMDSTYWKPLLVDLRGSGALNTNGLRVLIISPVESRVLASAWAFASRSTDVWYLIGILNLLGEMCLCLFSSLNTWVSMRDFRGFSIASIPTTTANRLERHSRGKLLTMHQLVWWTNCLEPSLDSLSGPVSQIGILLVPLQDKFLSLLRYTSFISGLHSCKHHIRLLICSHICVDWSFWCHRIERFLSWRNGAWCLVWV